MPEVKRADRMALAVAAGAISTGLFILISSSGIRLGSGYDRIGPRFFPYVVAAGLLISGIFMLVDCLRHVRVPDQIGVDKTAFLVIILSLILVVVLLQPAGFIITATILFTLIAHAFKSSHLLRDAVVGLLLAITVYLSFTIGLGLMLPQGFLSGLI